MAPGTKTTRTSKTRRRFMRPQIAHNFSRLQNWCQTIYELANVFALDRHEKSLCIRILRGFCADRCSSEGTTLHVSRPCASKPSRYGCVLNTCAHDGFRERCCH